MRSDSPEKRQFKIALGKTIRELRSLRKINQVEFGESTDMSQSKVSKLEKGTGTLEVDDFLKMLDHLNLSTSRFRKLLAKNLK